MAALRQLWTLESPVAGTAALTLSWSSDSSLDGSIVTENQFNNLREQLLVPAAYLAKGSGSGERISAHIANSDTYYACVRNLSLFAPS